MPILPRWISGFFIKDVGTAEPERREALSFLGRGPLFAMFLTLEAIVTRLYDSR